ncbi:hypothetical protein HPHPH4_0236 [Helicobacter pylori Hp H-4]|uniref:Uncharacterized protein n=1 Tax=Helicobacter pylori Hp P-15 TaxID=992080 RepID=J0F8F7_HELPX|nr:hypothetical protein HPHPH4_0236 [Helicobacter pylori Hp H-4]EJC08404.1 hypothetical protein HPHPP15_0366 [Helicobacter pylori Hp P-15]EJC32994.1 hypothetical protein HPHPP15B_0369 [Helicobacter pylori Hp P-15b]
MVVGIRAFSCYNCHGVWALTLKIETIYLVGGLCCSQIL